MDGVGHQHLAQREDEKTKEIATTEELEKREEESYQKKALSLMSFSSRLLLASRCFS